MKKPLCLALAVAIGSGGGTLAWAAPPAVQPLVSTQLPTGAQVQAGTVAITQSQTPASAVMNINQSTSQAIVNWQTFNVGSAAKVNINQPSSSSVLLNRVMDSNPSQIFGQINANGQVFLTNPNGVYFAPGSSVDVGSFTASTHSIADADFLNRNYSFSRNGATGSILNQGNITASLGGYIALMAPEVVNQGVVLAQLGGTVALAAGDAYQLQISNGKLSNVLVAKSALNTLVENGNAVQAPGGLIILSSQAASSLLGGVVKNSGSISATGLVSDGGEIRLTASNKIQLSPTSSISADAAPGSAGNGGRIDIIADLTNPTSVTLVDGSISAKGGLLGGNGGFIETSASQLGIADGVRISTLAPKGRMGEWLLDPYDITINASGPTADVDGSFTANGNSSVVKVSDLVAALGSSNVTVNAGIGGGTTGNITIASALDYSSTSNTLTLLSTGTGGLRGSSNITMGSGGLVVNQSGTSTYSGRLSGAGRLTKTGTGTLLLAQNNTYTGGTTIYAGTLGRDSDTPFGTGTVTVDGGTADFRGRGVSNNFIIGAGGPDGALTSSVVGEVYYNGTVSLSANSSIGGNVVSNFVFFNSVTSNGYGLVFIGQLSKLLWSVGNTLTTIATGPAIGPLSVRNNQALTIGQVVLGGTTYSGIDSTGNVEITTRSGDITVSQNVITTNTSSNGNAPALDFRAGILATAGTVTGGNLILSGSPTIRAGVGALAVFYTGSATSADATALTSNLSANGSVNTVYNRDASSNIYGSGYWVAFRGSPPVNIYLLPVSGQSSTYGTAPTAFNYCYSSSASSCQNVSYSGIPATNQSFTLGSGVVSSTVNVSSGVSGTLALTGSPSIASTGFVDTTSAGTYALTLTPSLTLSGYIFRAGNAVNYTIDRKPVTVTNAARAPAVYDGLTTYATLANGTTFTTSALVGSDTVGSVTQTASGTGVVQAGTYTITPSAPVLTTGNANNYSFSFAASSNTVAAKAVNLSIRKTYDGAASFTSANSYGTASNYAITGMVNSEAAPTISSGTASTSSANAATYSSWSSTALVLSNSNYTLSGGTVAATVDPKPVTVTNASLAPVFYDGVSTYASLASGTTFTTGTLVGSDAVGSVTQTASGTGVAQAGAYSVTPSAAVLSTGNADNYSFSYVAASNTVLRTYLVLIAINASKTFDGNTSSSVAPRVVGLLGTDSISGLTQAYSDIAVGAGKTLTIQPGYTIADRSGGNNYQVTLVPDTTGVITGLPVVAPPVIQQPTVAPSTPAPLTAAPSTQTSNAPATTAAETAAAANPSTAPASTTPASSASTASVVVPAPSTAASTGASAAGASSGGAVRAAPGAGSSTGVSVSTINSPSVQTPGLVSVLVPQGTATSGTGLVIALPEAVIAPAQGGNQSVSVALANNQALPNWIRYDADSKALVTTAVPAGAFPLSVVVTVGNQSTVVQVSESQVTP